MKGLRQFVTFDLPRFLAGKTLIVISVNDLVDYDSNVVSGKKVECAIVRDETVYAPSKDGNKASNLYEKVTVKVKAPNTVNVGTGDEVVPLNATATVYGEYSNKLSITATGFELKTQKGKN